MIMPLFLLCLLFLTFLNVLACLDDYAFVSFVRNVFDISECFSVSRNGKKVNNSMLNSTSGHQTF